MEDVKSLRSKEKEEFKQEENKGLNKAIAKLSTDEDDSKRHDDISSKLDTQNEYNEKLEKHNKEIKDHDKTILKIVKKDSLAHKAVQNNIGDILKITEKDSLTHKAVQDNIGKLIQITTDFSNEVVSQLKPALLALPAAINDVPQLLLTDGRKARAAQEQAQKQAQEQRKGLLGTLKSIYEQGKFTLTEMVVAHEMRKFEFWEQRADRIKQRKEEKEDFKKQVAERRKEILAAAKADAKRAKIEKLANKESLLEKVKKAPGKGVEFVGEKIKAGAETLWDFIKTALKGAGLIALVLGFNTFIKSDAFKNLIEYLKSGKLIDDLVSLKESIVSTFTRIVDFFKEHGDVISTGLELLIETFIAYKLLKGFKALKGIVSGAISVAKTVGKGAIGVAKTVGKGVKGAAQTATNVAAKTAGKQVAVVAAKETGEAAAKGLAKGFFKKLPGLGLIMGSGFAVKRAIKGDFVGAALELGGGIASTFPGVGTALSLATEAALIARDVNKASQLAQANRDAEQSANGNNVIIAPQDASTQVVNNSQQTTNLNGASMPIASLRNTFGYDEAMAY